MTEPTAQDQLDARECWASMRRLAREWTSPHSPPASASNFELMAMNVARYAGGCDALIAKWGLDCSNWVDLNETAARGGEDPQIVRVWATCEAWWKMIRTTEHGAPLGRTDVDATTGEFLGEWLLGGFPRLEISHKYAAALCCTDCPPEIEIRAPWKAWSLVVPPGLFGDERTPARLWVLGSRWVGMLWPDGFFQHVENKPAVSAFAIMMENLISGACLSLADPEQHRKPAGSSHSKGNKRSGPPDLSLARFLLAPPVTVDLRQHLADALKPGGGGVPKVQFLVRGHFRQQVHGAGRALRKTIWIEPHWKGPETGHVLLRPHQLKDKPEPV